MAVSLVMPKVGMIMTEGTVAKWVKRQGDKAKKGEVVVEIETGKTTFEVEASQDGVVFPVIGEGTVVPVDALIGYLLADGEAPPTGTASATPAVAPSAAKAAETSVVAPAGEIRASPIAKRLASELGVDITKVTGTGPGGRITESDVRAFAEKPAAAAPAKPTAAPAAPSAAKTVVPVRGIRKVIAQRMQQSLQNSAQFTLTLEVDMTEAVELRKQLAHDSGGEGTGRISTTDVVIKAVAEALKRHPRINAMIAGDEIHELEQINIGVAVALKEGLTVPVVFDADKKSVFEIGKTTAALIDKAEKGTLLPEETMGSTFTISMLGQVDAFTPIINPPESAILGVGRIVQKPAIYKGEIAKRSMCVLSLTVDHRLIDGAPGAAFLRRVGQYLESRNILEGLLKA